ncbi:MAG: chemotaxis protein [Sporomusaceae bacterium]|jgi:two-component system chemotaxis response regulator CheV|nr:chemotaxis protein [Sporomusaceae bacterium]
MDLSRTDVNNVATDHTDKGILLETGTNEFEIVEFSIGSVSYGINVAKVREVINVVPITVMPNVHHWVDGIFTLRGRVMPLVNLPRCLNAQSTATNHKVIVSELNNYYIAFLVDEVSRIHRISWKDMEPPPQISSSEMVVGIIKMIDKIVVLLDFEKILAEVNPDMGRKFADLSAVDSSYEEERRKKVVMVAEDSPMLRDLIVDTLRMSGYENILLNENGQEAWDKLDKIARSEIPVDSAIHLVVSDIEMPKMDGHHLTKLIKEHDKLKHLPVILFSSLINEPMRLKGLSVGADGQISKPEIGQLVALVDDFVLHRKKTSS